MMLSVEELFLRLTRRVIYITVITLVVVSALLLAKDWMGQRKQFSIQMTDVLEKIQRSLEGELFLGRSDSINLLKDQNIRAYSLEDLVISDSPSCTDARFCVVTNFPSNKKNYSITIFKSFRYVPSLSFLYFLIGSLLGLGLLSVHLYGNFLSQLKSSVIEPLMKLNRKVDEEITSENAAKEIYDLSIKIKDYLRQRDNYLKKEALFEMASHVAHDIRSPVAALKILQKSISVEDPLKELVDNSISRIQKISDDLLTKSKVTTMVSVADLIRSIDDVFKEKELLFGQKKVVVSKRVEKVDGKLSLDLNTFSRVISNVLHNSYEAVPECGAILLTLSCNGSKIKIAVEDDGAGFPQEVLQNGGKQKIVSTKIDGNGLGLMGVSKFVADCGGSMRISNTDSGARLELELPLLVDLYATLEA